VCRDRGVGPSACPGLPDETKEVAMTVREDGMFARELRIDRRRRADRPGRPTNHIGARPWTRHISML
jgi:hypothetical protein